jgi:hypothetical protein
MDIRTITQESNLEKDIIVGGGGLLFQRFKPYFDIINNHKIDRKVILWGAGSQIYENRQKANPTRFNYAQYLTNFDLVGLRDSDTPYDWVPCASCMHPSFDKARTPRHEFVVFSHKKFQIDIPGIPKLSNQTNDFEAVLDFLGSGETILTSSFHGAYWGTLLGRRVLAFAFSSKFFTLRHQPALYPVKKWTQPKFEVSILGRVLHSSEYDDQKLLCDISDWKHHTQNIPVYPDALEECREQNRYFYQQVINILDPR